jgi:subtilisin family serine protease
MNLGETRSKHGLKEMKSLDQATTKLVTYDTKASSMYEVIKDLKASGQVVYAEPNYVRNSNAVTDPFYSLQWGLKNTGQKVYTTGTPGIDIGIEYAWPVTKGSSTTVVAVIDSGIDINHPDLKNNIWTNPGEIAGDGLDNDLNGFIDDINGWDFAHHDNTVFDSADEDFHGTHVAGTIGAANNNIGVVGVAPNVKIMPLKYLTSDGGSIADEIAAINYAKSMGVKVINISSGGPGFSQAEHDGIANSNAIIVASAGNEGKNNDGEDPDYPASYHLENIISVGAMDSNGAVSYTHLTLPTTPYV